MVDPACRFENMSAPAVPKDFSWHLAAKKEEEKKVNKYKDKTTVDKYRKKI